MSYQRVIPRDFFNESKLLKCMGQLSLKVLDYQTPKGVEISIDENLEPFDIQLSDSGFMFVSNYPVQVNGVEILFTTTYNSKANYPLYAWYDDEQYKVFDEDGNFHKDFIAMALCLPDLTE